MYSEGNSEYFAICDSWANNILPNDLPHTPIVPVCWGGDEPSVPFQGFGRVDCALFVSDRAGSVVRDIPSADGWFVPMLLKPVEELLRGVDLGLLLGCSWSALRESIEDGWWHGGGSLSCCG